MPCKGERPLLADFLRHLLIDQSHSYSHKADGTCAGSLQSIVACAAHAACHRCTARYIVLGAVPCFKPSCSLQRIPATSWLHARAIFSVRLATMFWLLTLVPSACSTTNTILTCAMFTVVVYRVCEWVVTHYRPQPRP
jgi:hypothetical protein